MLKSILLTLFYLALFNFLLYRFKGLRFKHFKPFITYLLFNLKFVVGILIWFIYTFYYKDVQNNDVHKFYTDALVVREAASENPKAFFELMTGIYTGAKGTTKYLSQMKNWERNFDESPFNENKTIIRFNALLLFVSFRTYFVHILFMCFISLIGWVLLTDAVFSFANPRNAIMALPVLFLPSVLFWTSGVMKEPLLVVGLGLFVHGVLISDRGSRISDLITIVLGALIILFTKFFVLVCLLPASIAYLLFRRQKSAGYTLLKFATINILLLSVAFTLPHLFPKINPAQMLVNKEMHSIKEADYFKAGSRIEIPVFTANALSILKAAPTGISNTLTRPYLWEGKNVMMLASVLENLFILPFILFCVCFTNWRRSSPPHPLSQTLPQMPQERGNSYPFVVLISQRWNVFFFLLNAALAYFAIIGMCTPVLGNLVRYKAPLLPLFLFAFAMMMEQRFIAKNLDFVLAKNE